jgi:hypothetical protein
MPEKVLLVSSSTEANVSSALLALKTRLFPDSQLDLLCSLAELSYFEGRTELHQILIFPHRRDLSMALKILYRIWREKYDVVAMLWCLDTHRFRPKFFALLCGGRRLLVFNENLDCNYLTPKFLKALVVARAYDGSLSGNSLISAALVPLKDGYWGLLRILIFPIRLLILIFSILGLYIGRAWRQRANG